MVRCLRFSDRKTVGTMKIKTKLLILDLLNGVFGLLWAGAAIASVFFLYGALANDAPWPYLIWSIIGGFIAMQIAAALNDNKHRLDYVNQLTERGYTPAAAGEAWLTASDGGMNLLRNLQQEELRAQIEPFEAAINVSKAHGNSA